MKRETISNQFHYKVIFDYEGVTYPSEILYALENSIILKAFGPIKKQWRDDIEGLLVHTKKGLMENVKGRILNLEPANKENGSNISNVEAWILEVEVDDYEKIPPEWIALSVASV